MLIVQRWPSNTSELGSTITLTNKLTGDVITVALVDIRNHGRSAKVGIDASHNWDIVRDDVKQEFSREDIGGRTERGNP